MISNSLYHITAELLDIERELVEHPEASEGIIEEWIRVNAKLPDKIDSLAALIRSLAASEAMFKGEAQLFTQKAQTAANAQARLKNALSVCMDALQVEEIPGKLFKVRKVANGGIQPVAVHVPAEELPEPYRQTEVKPNLVAIRAALEEGQEVEGCELLPRGKHVRIN